MKLRNLSVALFAAAAVTLPGISAQASSHREAPNITRMPLVDGTDFYMFRSYEAGRDGFVTLIANYQPLQLPFGGPNYFTMDPNALYEIHVDNNGDALEDITFQFRFQNTLNDVQLPIGTENVSIPLTQAGQVTAPGSASLNVSETYTVNIVRGDRRKGTSAAITNSSGGSATFIKPVDNIGTKTIPDYPTYADAHIYTVDIPGCNTADSKLFVGQRREGFAVNLGRTFDLVNAPLSILTDRTNMGDADKGNTGNISNGKFSVTTLALEVPIACLTNGSDPVIGAWTTASIRQGTLVDGSPKSGHRTSLKQGGAWTQVSRLGMPLVNEVVIGLKDKDKFNASKPKDDTQFLTYVTNPTLPALLDIALSLNIAPSVPRGDLAVTFLTGIPELNQPASATPSEMLRLNTAIPPVAEGSQNPLGVLGSIVAEGSVNAFLANIGTTSDAAGFPNGRRPKDDVVDISLAAVEGALCLANGAADSLGSTADGNVLGLNGLGIAATDSTCNASATKVPFGTGTLGLNDGVAQENVPFLNRFPYLNHPMPGDTTPGNF
jgi:hypothetical protein